MDCESLSEGCVLEYFRVTQAELQYFCWQVISIIVKEKLKKTVLNAARITEKVVKTNLASAYSLNLLLDHSIFLARLLLLLSHT